MTIVLEFVMTYRHGVVAASKLGDPPSAIARVHPGVVISAVPPFLLNIFIPGDLEGLFIRLFCMSSE